MKNSAELGEELCKYCPYTEHGTVSVNTGLHNLCEGSKCDVAYSYYLEDSGESEVTD